MAEIKKSTDTSTEWIYRDKYLRLFDSIIRLLTPIINPFLGVRLLDITKDKLGHDAGVAAGWGTAQQIGRSRVRFPMVSLEFFIDTILPAALWPWGWLSL